MKRVKSGAILQTLLFAQKEEAGLSPEEALALNREEVAAYKRTLERSHTRYQITDEAEQPDGSILLHVRKQYNAKVDVSEYFQ